jgi:hypothetical protein
MLTAVALADQWDDLESQLGEDWADARVRLSFSDPATASQAFALLGPVNPGRSGEELRLFAVRRGSGAHATAVRRALQRLDREGIEGTLELAGTTEAPAAAEADPEATLVEGWDRLQRQLPSDWSDLLLELRLRSSDYVPRASLRMTPLAARRAASGPPALQFRVARGFGYGAAPEMVQRCLERCDEDSIRGELHLLRVLSSTDPVHTQGPVWQLAGRTV